MDQKSAETILYAIGDVVVSQIGTQFEVTEIYQNPGSGQFLAIVPLAGQRTEKKLYRWCPAYDFRPLAASEKRRSAAVVDEYDIPPEY